MTPNPSTSRPHRRPCVTIGKIMLGVAALALVLAALRAAPMIAAPLCWLAGMAGATEGLASWRACAGRGPL